MSKKNKNRSGYFTNEQDYILEKQYKYLSKFSEIIYENECSLENSYMNQASRLQEAISILTVVILTLIPILFHYLDLSKKYIAIWAIVIFTTLLFSLIFASIAQYRRKRTNFPNKSKLRTQMEDNYDDFKTNAQLSKYFCTMYEEIQGSYFVENEHTKILLKISIVLFICALFICLLAIFVSITLIAYTA